MTTMEILARPTAREEETGAPRATGPEGAGDGAAIAAVRKLAPALAARAAAHDEGDEFVADAFEELRASGLLAAGVPSELGGMGASQAGLGAALRELAKACSSTALAFAMHTHLVATTAWRWRHRAATVEPLLRRVASERLVLLSTGGADWLDGSGRARRVDGGFVIDARKSFVSGAPAGDLMMTSAVLDDPPADPAVVHLTIPMRAAGVRVEPTWRALGMRGTGSHDVVLEEVFVPDAAAGVRRPRGRWHELLHVVSMVAIPLIYSVYVGVAERARQLAIAPARRGRSRAGALGAVGELELELRAAQLALDDMIRAGDSAEPGLETTNRVMLGRALVGRATRRVVDLAMDVAGGGAFYRAHELERLFRDVQASRYHPLQDGGQRDLAARLALGLPPDGELPVQGGPVPGASR